MRINTQRAIQSIKFHISNHMKPYSNVKVMGRVIPVLVYLENCSKLGRLGPNSPYHSTDTQKVIHSVTLLISHQMKPYSSVKSHLRVNLYILFFCICEIGASWQNLAQLSQIMSRDTQNIIQNVKFYISHQMKPYLSVKTI